MTVRRGDGRALFLYKVPPRALIPSPKDPEGGSISHVEGGETESSRHAGTCSRFHEAIDTGADPEGGPYDLR